MDYSMLTPEEYKAIQELKGNIEDTFEVVNIVLYGSKARGEAVEYSDVNLLILTNMKRTKEDRERLSNLVAEINIKYGVGLSFLYCNVDDWKDGNINPALKEQVDREGINITGENVMPDHEIKGAYKRGYEEACKEIARRMVGVHTKQYVSEITGVTVVELEKMEKVKLAFNPIIFVDYIRELRAHLFDDQTLEDILVGVEKNHRNRRFIVMYFLQSPEMFQEYYRKRMELGLGLIFNQIISCLLTNVEKNQLKQDLVKYLGIEQTMIKGMITTEYEIKEMDEDLKTYSAYQVKHSSQGRVPD